MISPLQIDFAHRSNWGEFDALAIAKLAPLAYDECYQTKYYVAPDSDAQLMEAKGYLTYGLEITPGSIIVGYIGNQSGFVVQVTDMATAQQFWSDPIPIQMIQNGSPYSSAGYPDLMVAPYPVIGDGLFKVEIWNPSVESARVQLVFVVFEVVK